MSCKSDRLKSNLTWGNTKSQNYAQIYDALCHMLQLKSERDPDTKKDKGTGTIAHFNGVGGGGEGGTIYQSPSSYISL